jgi:hypothetical protein
MLFKRSSSLADAPRIRSLTPREVRVRTTLTLLRPGATPNTLSLFEQLDARMVELDPDQRATLARAFVEGVQRASDGDDVYLQIARRIGESTLAVHIVPALEDLGEHRSAEELGRALSQRLRATRSALELASAEVGVRNAQLRAINDSELVGLGTLLEPQDRDAAEAAFRDGARVSRFRRGNAEVYESMVSAQKQALSAIEAAKAALSVLCGDQTPRPYQRELLNEAGRLLGALQLSPDVFAFLRSDLKADVPGGEGSLLKKLKFLELQAPESEQLRQAVSQLLLQVTGAEAVIQLATRNLSAAEAAIVWLNDFSGILGLAPPDLESVTEMLKQVMGSPANFPVHLQNPTLLASGLEALTALSLALALPGLADQLAHYNEVDRWEKLASIGNAAAISAGASSLLVEILALAEQHAVVSQLFGASGGVGVILSALVGAPKAAEYWRRREYWSFANLVTGRMGGVLLGAHSLHAVPFLGSTQTFLVGAGLEGVALASSRARSKLHHTWFDQSFAVYLMGLPNVSWESAQILARTNYAYRSVVPFVKLLAPELGVPGKALWDHLLALKPRQQARFVNVALRTRLPRGTGEEGPPAEAERTTTSVPNTSALQRALLRFAEGTKHLHFKVEERAREWWTLPRAHELLADEGLLRGLEPREP